MTGISGMLREPENGAMMPANATTDTIDNTHSVFLQTPAAQGIAGAFTWLALLITGHQVILLIFKHSSFFRN